MASSRSGVDRTRANTPNWNQAQAIPAYTASGIEGHRAGGCLMLYDLTVSDACFAEGHAPQDIDEVFGWARHRLGPAARSWRLISARRKLGRTLFEIEEETPS